jgi:hypothetical protein
MSEWVGSIQVGGEKRWVCFNDAKCRRIVPIHESDNLSLSVTRTAIEVLREHGVTQPGKQFAGYFCRTWEALPKNVRSELLRYWGQVPKMLRIQLGTRNLNTLKQQLGRMLANWHRNADRPRKFVEFGPRALGVCDRYGFFLGFDPVGDLQQEMAAAVVIAHELAHAYHWATGKFRATLEDEEAATEELVREWGFKYPWEASQLAIEAVPRHHPFGDEEQEGV